MSIGRQCISKEWEPKLEPATACLEGRRLRSRRSFGLHRPYSRFYTVHVQCERARQKMSRAFFSRFGKTCHVFFSAISAKNVARILGQAVTPLDTLYLIPSSLARLPRKEVLIPSPVVKGFAQTDIGNLSARIRLPRFASVDYTGFLPEEAARNNERERE